MFSSDPMSEIKFDFVFGWYKKTEYDSWLKLTEYAQEEYQKRFKNKPNIGFVHLSSFIPEYWILENLIIFKSKYCTRNVIFLGEIEDVLFQNLLRQVQETQADTPV